MESEHMTLNATLTVSPQDAHKVIRLGAAL